MKYILINGKESDFEFLEDKKERLVTIVGNNVAVAARKYGYCFPYTNMSYGVSVTMGRYKYCYEFKNIVAAEGFAVLAAFCNSKEQLDNTYKQSESVLIGYAINFDVMWKIEDMPPCEF